MAIAQMAFLDVATPTEPPAYSHEARVLARLRQGYHNQAWPRTQLADWTGLPDRTVRKAILALIEAGFAIVSSSHGAGYSLATDPSQLEPAIAETRSRIGKLRDRAEALDRAKLMLGTEATA